jgi:hypothetical protein
LPILYEILQQLGIGTQERYGAAFDQRPRNIRLHIRIHDPFKDALSRFA